MGTFPCKSSKCHLCPNLNTSPTITGPNGVPIKISGNFNCNSSNIIFAISCNLCPKAIYIGETSNSIRQRMNGHRSDIKHNRNKPVAEHFNKPDHTLDNLKLTVIKEVKGKTKQQRGVEEQKIIFKLDCVNQGVNKNYSFMSNRTNNLYLHRIICVTRRSVLILNYKNKGDAQCCGNYREIKLMCHTMKI